MTAVYRKNLWCYIFY